ncbi:hypothetical protein PTKIN_Ptkin14bG0173800 [Pterospermum kingtungense]
MGGNLSYYRDSVVVIMKGVDIKLERILTIFTTIDMSSNKFEGKIAEVVGNLSSLQVLNFSHKKLTSHIPSSFKNLAAIESLDLCSEFRQTCWGYSNAVDRFEFSSSGFPLLKRCGYDELVVPIFHEESDSAFGLDWKFVVWVMDVDWCLEFQKDSETKMAC